MTARITLAIAVLGALMPTSAGRAQPAPVPLDIPAERYQLPNGLEVILHQDRRIPVVYVNVTYHVGSGNDLPGQSGYAHLFEHLMFQGSKHTGSDQHFAVLRGLGARDANGTTNTDRTNYYQSVPAAELETALWLESDRMGYLTLDQAALDNQRAVVRNERRDRYENVAFNQEIFTVARILYPEGHPYRHLTIGLHEDLERATLADARAFFARWYVPANATLLLAGDFDRDMARALVAKWFGSFPRSRRPQTTPPAAPPLGRAHREMLTDTLATTTRVRYVWPSPAFFAAGDAELDLISDLLTSTTGRLRKLLTYDRALATSVSSAQQSRAFSSEFHIVVDVRPGVSVSEIDDAILIAIAGLGRSVQERELKQAVAAREVTSARSIESLAARGSRLQLYNLYGREPNSITWDLQRYRKVRPADIQATATRVLGAGRVEVITVPAPKPSAAQAERPRVTPAMNRAAIRFEAAQPLEALDNLRLPQPAARIDRSN